MNSTHRPRFRNGGVFCRSSERKDELPSSFRKSSPLFASVSIMIQSIIFIHLIILLLSLRQFQSLSQLRRFKNELKRSFCVKKNAGVSITRPKEYCSTTQKSELLLRHQNKNKKMSRDEVVNYLIRNTTTTRAIAAKLVAKGFMVGECLFQFCFLSCSLAYLCGSLFLPPVEA